jgi:beta-phosphoglucomutase-like phosphatase (HAD superfamily)
MLKMRLRIGLAAVCAGLACASGAAWGQQAEQAKPEAPIVLHAARMLDVAAGKVVSPGEVLVVGERIEAVGAAVEQAGGGAGD